MAERLRDAWRDFKGGHLSLKFLLKGYVSRKRLWTIRWGNGHTVLQLCRYTFSHKETL